MRWMLVSVCCLAVVSGAWGAGGLPRDASLEESLAHVRSVLDGLKEGRRAGEREGLLGRAQAIDALGRAYSTSEMELLDDAKDRGVGFVPESLWAWLGTGVRCTESDWTEDRHRAFGRHTRNVKAEAADAGWVDQALSLLVDGRRVEAADEGFPRMSTGARRLRILLQAEAIDCYQRGETARALRAHAALVELAEHFALYGDIISDLTSCGVFTDAARLVWEAIERGALDGDAAEALLRVFEVEPDLAAMRRDGLVCQVEIMEVVQKTVGWYGEDGVVRPELASRAPEVLRMGVAGVAITLPALGAGERYATAAETIVAIQEWAEEHSEEAAKPRAERDLQRFERPLIAEAGARVPEGLVFSASMLDRVFSATDDAAFAAGAARLALAVEVYRHRHGRLPERLDDLVPGVLEGLPRDPWAEDGRYRYRLTDASHLGYVLYGVGLNGEDNGGVQPELCLDVPSDLKWDGAVDCVVLPRRRMEAER